MTVNAGKVKVRKFEETGSLDVVPGRRRRATEPTIVEEVAIAARAEPSESSSNTTVSGLSIARTPDIPWATVRMILRKVLNIYPCQMHYVQQLKPQDHSARLDFALSFLERIEVGEYRPSHILKTDKAHFHLDGAMNTQNCRIGDSTNPHSVQQQLLYSPYVTARCGFHPNFTLGLHFFEEVTMNGF